MWHESGRSISSSLPTNGTQWSLRVVSDRSARRPADLARPAHRRADPAQWVARPWHSDLVVRPLPGRSDLVVHQCPAHSDPVVHQCPAHSDPVVRPLPGRSDPVVRPLEVHLDQACSLLQYL